MAIVFGEETEREERYGVGAPGPVQLFEELRVLLKNKQILANQKQEESQSRTFVLSCLR